MWTKEEIDYLEENYRILSLDEICKHLHKKKSTVTGRIISSGLKDQYKDLPPVRQEDGTYLIPLNSKYDREIRYAIVDEIDVELVSKYRWSLHKGRNTNYAYTNSGSKKEGFLSIGMHSLIIPTDDGYEVDHKNNDGLDNRRENLRIATYGQNKVSTPHQKSRKGKHRGVGYHKRDKLYFASVGVGGKRKYFKKELDAAKHYDKVAYEKYGEFAQLNFPEDYSQAE